MSELIERNARIMELVEAGVHPKRIARMINEEGKCGHVSRQMVVGVRWRKMGALAPGSGNSKGDTLVRAKPAADHPFRNAPPRPSAPPRPPADPLSKYDTPAQPGGVSLLERTGCAWVSGDSREGTLTYCSAPCCRVRLADGRIERVRYCKAHWEKRNASRYTRIIP